MLRRARPHRIFFTAADSERLAAETARIVPTLPLIGNNWVKNPDSAKRRKQLHCGNPSNHGALLAHADVATAADVHAAVGAAKDAAGAWGARSVASRAAALRQIADRIDEYRDEIARVESLGSGLCIADALVSITSCASCFRFYASAIEALPAGQVLPAFDFGAPGGPTAPPNATSVVSREPLGVVGLVTPFNYPCEMGVWKIAPALAAGNTVVWKPPPQCPLGPLILAKRAFFDHTGKPLLPPGVVSVLPGDHVTGGALVAHPDVAMIGFTGGPKAGAAIQVSCAQHGLKRCALELGGNAAVVVAPDWTDMAAAADVAAQAFSHNGQSCTALRRAFVPRKLVLPFVEALSATAGKRAVGHALDARAGVGPLVDASAAQRVKAAVDDALKTHPSAELAFGNFVPSLPGMLAGRIDPVSHLSFLAATCVVGLPDSAALVAEELFGPVLCVQPYDPGAGHDAATHAAGTHGRPLAPLSDALEDVAARANATPYGLSSVVLSRDLRTAQGLAARLRAGTVWVNGVDAMHAGTPFGGVGRNGYGKDLGVAALSTYAWEKTTTTVYG